MYNDYNQKLDDKDSFTIIYLVSQNTSYASLKKYSVEFEVLKSHFPNTQSKIFLINYPDDYTDFKDGNINTKIFKDMTYKSVYGVLKIFTDGNYTYKVNNIKNLVTNTKLIDTFTIIDIYGKNKTINIDLKVNSNGELKVISEFTPKGMYRYLTELKEYGFQSPSTKFHVHPLVFESLNLKVVPAYLLTYCDNEDFRYKECKNEFLLRGNITLTEFLKTVSNKDKNYDKYYTALLSGKKE